MTFHDTVLSFSSRYKHRWRELSDAFPACERTFELPEQTRHEEELDDLVSDVTATLESKRKRRKEEARRLVKANVLFAVARMMAPEGDRAAREFLAGCSDVADDFVRRSRAFDPAISLEDIHQALRNIWIVNSIQSYLGERVRLTDGSFAYSLLYPYTDNFLDDPCVRSQHKRAMVGWLDARLRGATRPRAMRHLAGHARLIALIEKEFDRALYPEVYESLLAIHRAQILSLEMQGRGDGDAGRMLDISVLKGGTSVLADGYLAGGTLTPRQGRFLFGYGVGLQLIDDLQDISPDLGHGARTLFSSERRQARLEGMTNRLIRFVGFLLEKEERRKGWALARLVHHSCFWLIVEGVARNRPRFSPGYCARLERCSPVRFSWMIRFRERLDAFSANVLHTGTLLQD